MTVSNSNVQVRIGGEAGQGVILAGVILAQAAMNDGKKVGQSARYGAAVRGGDATADIVISEQSIDYPHVEIPDSLVVLSQPTYDQLLPGVKDGGLVIYDPFFVTPTEDTRVRQVPVAGTEAALAEFGKGTAANLIFLAVLSSLTQVVSRDSLQRAVEEDAPPRFLKSNRRALEIGREMAGEVKP